MKSAASMCWRAARIFAGCVALLLLGSAAALATPPCPPDISNLCQAIGGTWTPTETRCPGSGKCSKEVPLMDYRCKKDSDCMACGLNQCKPDISRFTEQEREALRHEPTIDMEYYENCEKPFNQVCGCRYGSCYLKEEAVDCRTDADCYYCCGSCQPMAWREVADCTSHCILSPGKQFDCSCLNNKCRRAAK